ncbi:MAG: copper amine oxidase N-terminal domain-containing protein, partial [Lachnospiraceae bacterium]|nr:copper amine oxidase N-terminal domain-containing protein [Lachnospiraceae bacterium]
MTLSYNNKQVSYIGTVGKVNFDGENVSLGTLPSILINNTAMLRAYNVFKKAMGITYSFNQKTGSITFKTGDITLSMQENSTAAYRNGEYFDCGVAPICVTNVANGTMALMVPGRFVSEMLGYDYNWNSTTHTSEIRTTSQVGVYVEPQKPTTAPIQVTQPTATDQVDYSFVVDAERYLGFENTLDNAQTSISRASTGNIAILQQLTQNTEELYNEQYVLRFDRPVGSVQSLLDEGLLTVTVMDAYCFEREYMNPAGSLITHIAQTQDSSNNAAVFRLELSDILPYYDLKLSADGCSLYITVFPNYLVGLEVGQNQTGRYMRFKGLRAFHYTLGSENGYQAVYLHNTCNTVGNLVFPD